MNQQRGPLREHERLVGLAIDGIDDEGRGRAVIVRNGVEHDVAVRGAVVGDVVDAVVERAFPARQLVQARRLGVLGTGAGPLHIARDCPHPGPCAACPLHGVDAGFVAAVKQQRVRQALADVGLNDVVIAPVIEGDGVRQKIKLVAGGRAGALVLGHYVPHSHVVVEAAGCAHARDDLVIAVDAVRERLDEAGLGPELVVAVIARSFVEGVAVVVVANGPCPIEIADLFVGHIDCFNDDDDRGDDGDRLVEGHDAIAVDAIGVEVIGVAWRQQSSSGSKNAIVGGEIDVVAGTVCGTPLGFAIGAVDPVHVDSFCQADARGAAWLVEYAATFVMHDVADDDVVLDLYAGTGAFARALVAHGAQHVVAVESFPASVTALSTLKNTTAVGGKVEDAITSVLARAPVAAVVDPPRKGLLDVAAVLASSSLRRVAVVSCDVDAGARDVKALVAGGFVIVEVVPVDLFPGSAEVEMLTLLRR